MPDGTSIDTLGANITDKQVRQDADEMVQTAKEIADRHPPIVTEKTLNLVIH